MSRPSESSEVKTQALPEKRAGTMRGSQIGNAAAVFATVFLVCLLLDWKHLPLEKNLLVSLLGAACFMILYLLYDLVTGRRQRTKG